MDALAIGVSRARPPEMIERALKFDLDDGVWFGDFKVEDLPGHGSYGGSYLGCSRIASFKSYPNGSYYPSSAVIF